MILSHSAQDLLCVPGSSDLDRKRSGKTLARPSSPLLRAKNAFRRTFSNGGDKSVLQREREAKDAISWLRAAGFPQYVQMYADGDFPIDLSQIQVERDHRFLDEAAIESLLRRLRVLNQCADLFLARVTKYSKEEESDEEDLRALSSHWKFQKRSKKWSRQHSNGQSTDTNDHRLLSSRPGTELSRSLTNLRNVKGYSFADTKDDDDQPLLKTQSVFCLPSHCSKSEGYFSGNDEPEPEQVIPELVGSQPDLPAIVSAEAASNAVTLTITMRNCHTLPTKLPLVQIDRPRHFSSPPTIAKNQEQTPVDECDSPGVLSSAVFFSGEEFVSSTESILEAFTNEVSSKVASLRRKATNIVSGSLFQQQANSSAYGSSSLSDSYMEDQENILQPDPNITDKQFTSEHSVFLPAVDVAGDDSQMFHRRNDNVRRARHVWHSYQKGHSFRQALKPVRPLIPIDELSVGQMTVLRKLSLVRLTSLLEMHNASSKILSRLSWNRQPKVAQYKDKKVFGVPLLLNIIKTGCALPKTILHAISYLRKNGLTTKGIFRKAAYRSRVSSLKELTEANPDYVNYSEFTPYEVADFLKLYFRELPETLLTDKLSEVLLSVQEGIPEAARLQALQSVMLLMPDENREALHYLLTFLFEVAEHSDINQMDIHNLCVCFAPSIFTLPSMVKTSPLVKSRATSFRTRSSSASRTPPSSITSSSNKEVTETMAAHKCLEIMVEEVDRLFMIPSDMIHVCQFSYLEDAEPVPHHELGQDRYGFGDFHSYISTCVSTTLKECRQKAKGWQHYDVLRGVEVSGLMVNDGVPLRVWKGTVEIPTNTDNVLKRLWSERHLWDADLIKCRVVSRIDDNTEVFQYVTQAPPPLANRDTCILRAWRSCRDNCYAVVSTSVSHPAAALMGSIRTTVLATRFLIEPNGPNASRLTILNRVDIRGHSGDYYNHCYGAHSTLCVAHIRDSFKKPNEPDYLETEV
ncbi:rho GTPase-activating protein 7-like isoform X2 [Dysidea avara]|uniref:rho GTPase-activating protein 7-like isoform X2 n=1 Tax=Dysidea avara TaxID=196820 RepID=UPI00331DEF96